MRRCVVYCSGYSAYTMSTAPGHADAISSAERQRLYAVQFRTILCENHDGPRGRCLFGRKCTFAHGKKQLRTPELNEAEGIINDKAIRTFLICRGRKPVQSPPCIEPPHGPVTVSNVNGNSITCHISTNAGGVARRDQHPLTCESLSDSEPPSRHPLPCAEPPRGFVDVSVDENGTTLATSIHLSVVSVDPLGGYTTRPQRVNRYDPYSLVRTKIAAVWRKPTTSIRPPPNR